MFKQIFNFWLFFHRFQDPQCSQQKSLESPKSEVSTEDIEDDFDEIPQKKQILQLEQENPSGSEVKKKRGRPPKSLKIKQNDLSPKITKIKLLKTSTKSPNFTVIENNDKNTEKRGRGRPPKALGLLGLKKKKKVQMSKLKKNRSPKISVKYFYELFSILFIFHFLFFFAFLSAIFASRL